MILILTMILPLLGCPKQIRIRTEVQEVYVPLLYCPAPIELVRPTLPIHMMTPEQANNPGEVAKHYKASIIILQGYSMELERSLKTYDDTNKAYDALKEKMQRELKFDGIITR